VTNAHVKPNVRRAASEMHMNQANVLMQAALYAPLIFIFFKMTLQNL